MLDWAGFIVRNVPKIIFLYVYPENIYRNDLYKIVVEMLYSMIIECLSSIEDSKSFHRCSMRNKAIALVKYALLLLKIYKMRALPLHFSLFCLCFTSMCRHMNNYIATYVPSILLCHIP